MKVYLDDIRETPDGWYRTYTVEETIQCLETRQVTHLSLDNDLGEDFKEGWNCLNWLEETVFFDETFPIPIISVHSSNASRVQSMLVVAKKLEQIRLTREIT